MFKKSTNDGAHANVFTEAAHAGTQSAHAANDEIDLHAGLGGVIERANGFAVEQRVHLGDDARGAASAGVVCFALDEMQQIVCERHGSDEQRAVALFLCVGCEVVEDVLNGQGNFFVCGEQADVGVEARGDGVVVAGAEVGVAARDSVRVSTDDERELGVGFEADDAVKDLHASVFERACPADVAVFIEPGH